MGLTAELVSVGTELLLGDIINTNAAELGQLLAANGISVYRQSTVGDNAERLRGVLREALSRADLVITTGGLGPTYDDLTTAVAAEAAGVELVCCSEAEEQVSAALAARGVAMTESQRKQAYLPRGCTVLRNRYGTAPGCLLECGGRHLILLPGPPHECLPMFREEVLPHLSALCDRVFLSHNIHIFGMGEAKVGDLLHTLMTESRNPTFAPYCAEGEVRVRVTASAAQSAEAESLCSRGIAAVLESPVGAHVYGIDCKDLQHAAVEALRRCGKTVAVAESCTAGLVAARLAEVPGSSAVLEGSLVTYADRIKAEFCGVREETLATYGAVSRETALEMAEGVRRAMRADLGIGITGFAGPGGGTDENPVGTVYLASAHAGGSDVHRLFVQTGERNPESARAYVRHLAASHALFDMLRALGAVPYAQFNKTLANSSKL